MPDGVTIEAFKLLKHDVARLNAAVFFDEPNLPSRIASLEQARRNSDRRDNAILVGVVSLCGHVLYTLIFHAK